MYYNKYTEIKPLYPEVFKPGTHQADDRPPGKR